MPKPAPFDTGAELNPERSLRVHCRPYKYSHVNRAPDKAIVRELRYAVGVPSRTYIVTFHTEDGKAWSHVTVARSAFEAVRGFQCFPPFVLKNAEFHGFSGRRRCTIGSVESEVCLDQTFEQSPKHPVNSGDNHRLRVLEWPA